MPELPEVESARATIEAAALHRRIADVDDTDTYECRPHAPGDIKEALVGRSLTAAHRQGKSMWCETSSDGPVLGIHLGMSGRIVVTANRVGADTQLAQMARLVEDAQNGKAQVQRLADRISGIFVPAVLALAAATLTGWLVAGAGIGAAFTAAALRATRILRWPSSTSISVREVASSSSASW